MLVDLEFRVPQDEKGEHRRPYVYERMWGSLVLYRCDCCCCCTAAVPPGRFSNAEELWVGIVQLVFRMTRTHTHTHTHAHTEAQKFVAVGKRRPRIAAGCGCAMSDATSKGLRCDTGTQQQDSAAKKKVRNTEIAPLFCSWDCYFICFWILQYAAVVHSLHTHEKQKKILRIIGSGLWVNIFFGGVPLFVNCPPKIIMMFKIERRNEGMEEYWDWV